MCYFQALGLRFYDLTGSSEERNGGSLVTDGYLTTRKILSSPSVPRVSGQGHCSPRLNDSGVRGRAACCIDGFDTGYTDGISSEGDGCYFPSNNNISRLISLFNYLVNQMNHHEYSTFLLHGLCFPVQR